MNPGPRGWSRRRVLSVSGFAALGLARLAHRREEPQERELLIRGGRVANADGVADADVRVVDEKIVEVGPGLRAGDLARVIDARARIVVPGGIDPHTHLHPSFADDLTSGSLAALAGGITTVGTFSSPRQGESVLTALDRMEATVRQEAVCDVILHTSAWPPNADLLTALPRLVERGQPSIKFYMVRSDFGAQIEQVIKTLEEARRLGIVTMMHCEDGALLAAAVRRLTARGHTGLEYYAESRPVLAEVAATQHAVALCADTGAPVYLVHMSCAQALAACRAARAAKLPLYLETRPLFIHLSEEKLHGPEFELYVGQPPLRPRADVDAMFRGLLDGSIDVLATDHAPWTRAQKMDRSLSISRVRPGASDLQFMLPMYFSEGRRRGLTIERFVATTSWNAAQIFGLSRSKGAIRPGYDADIAIWNPDLVRAVRAEDDLSKSDYSPYEGWLVTGWPDTVIRRGEIVVEGSGVVGRAGSGQLVVRTAWAP